jgi:hypothetical protein
MSALPATAPQASAALSGTPPKLYRVFSIKSALNGDDDAARSRDSCQRRK